MALDDKLLQFGAYTNINVDLVNLNVDLLPQLIECKLSISVH